MVQKKENPATTALPEGTLALTSLDHKAVPLYPRGHNSKPVQAEDPEDEENNLTEATPQEEQRTSRAPMFKRSTKCLPIELPLLLARKFRVLCACRDSSLSEVATQVLGAYVQANLSDALEALIRQP